MSLSTLSNIHFLKDVFDQFFNNLKKKIFFQI